RSFWGLTELQVRLRQVGRGTTQDFVLLLEQPVSALERTQFLGLGLRHARARAVLDVGPLEPVTKTRLRDPEVLRDLGNRSLATTSDRDHVVTELLGVGCRHVDILPAGTSRPHRSGVNRTFSSPEASPDLM